jgi:hypothetical protein
VLVLAAVLAVRFRRLTVEGVFVMADDTLNQYYPLMVNLFGRLRLGDLPSWSSEILLGYPALFTVDAHVFSPLQWPFLVFEPHVAVAVRFLAASLLSAVLMYALVLRLGTGWAGALTAAILWVTSWSAAYLQLEPMASATVPWFPLVLLCWDRFNRQGAWCWSMSAGLALGLALLGGHAQHVYWVVLFLVVYRLVVMGRGAPAAAGRLRSVVGFAMLCTIAALIAAVYVQPMLELLADSVRANLVLADRIPDARPAWGRTLLGLPMVLFQGTPVGLGAEAEMEYPRVGVLPVTLALLAFGRGRSFDNRLWAVALLFLALSFAGMFPPAHALVLGLPGNDFRFPHRIGLVWAFCVAVLAGRGASRLLPPQPVASVFLLRLAVLAAVSVPHLWPKWGSAVPLERSEAVTIVIELAALAVWLAAPPRLPMLRRLALAGALLAFTVHSAQVTEAIAPVEEHVLASLRDPGPGLRAGSRGQWGAWPAEVPSRLPRTDVDGPVRMLCVECGWPANAPLITGHETPAGYVSLRPRRVDEIVYSRSAPHHEDRLHLSQSWLDLMGVGFVANPEGLVENPGRLPRAYFVSHAVPAQSRSETRDRVTAEAFDPRREVVIEIDALPLANTGSATFVPARVSRHDHERVDVEVLAPQAGWLVLLDRYAPGWLCERDGEPVAILQANYLFRAVQVPAGLSRLVFRYHRPLHWWGAGISLLGLCLGGVGAAACVHRRQLTRTPLVETARLIQSGLRVHARDSVTPR